MPEIKGCEGAHAAVVLYMYMYMYAGYSGYKYMSMSGELSKTPGAYSCRVYSCTCSENWLR